jgi:hypothetical protein
VGVNGSLIGLKSAFAGEIRALGGPNGLFPGAAGALGPQQLRSSHPEFFQPQENLARPDPRPVLSLTGIAHSPFILVRFVEPWSFTPNSGK